MVTPMGEEEGAALLWRVCMEEVLVLGMLVAGDS